MAISKSKNIMIIGLVIFASGLLLFIYLGYFNRYWADDWCYNADLKKLGFWGTMNGYTYITTYASNRFSLTLFSGLIDFWGIPGLQLMTLSVVLLWCWGVYRLLVTVGQLFFSVLPIVPALFITTIIVYYSIYLAPHQYQSMYWRSGLLPYTAPVIFGVWVFVLIASSAVYKTWSPRTVFIVALLSFIGGGFSEAGNATLTSMLIAYVFAGLLFRHSQWARNSLKIAGPALLASVLAMIVLIVAPTNGYRIGLYDRGLDLVAFPRVLLYNTFDFIKFSFLDAPLPHLVVFGTLSFIGFLMNAQVKMPFHIKSLFIFVFVVILLTFLFVAASYAPSAYIEKSPPAPRTRILSQFLLILGYGTIAVVSGQYIRHYTSWRYAELLAVLILVLFYSYTVRSVILSVEKVSLFSEMAAMWDERDLQIRQSKDDGILDIYVRGIDGRPVGGIRDFKDKPGLGFWINQCASSYYEVDNIYATIAP